jgi:hypothetical protein
MIDFHEAQQKGGTLNMIVKDTTERREFSSFGIHS